MFLKFLNLFQRKNDKATAAPSISPSPPITATTTPDNEQKQPSQDEAIVIVKQETTPLPVIKVEFEQSRLLLEQLDHDFSYHQQPVVSFPKFDHLLVKQQVTTATTEEKEEEEEEEEKKRILIRKLSTTKLLSATSTLRHRMSLYRSPKKLNRTFSTPDFSSSRQQK